MDIWRNSVDDWRGGGLFEKGTFDIWFYLGSQCLYHDQCLNCEYKKDGGGLILK